MAEEQNVLLETFSQRSFAEAAVSLLVSEGIEAEIFADDAGGELPNLDFASGVRVMVPAADLERARELLSEPGEPT